MFVDDLEITIKAGDGGSGAVAFFPNKKGPCGGNGGDGGNVYIRGSTNMADLHIYAGAKVWKAEPGARGLSFTKDGRFGDDITILVPIGASITDTQTQETFEILNEEQILIAKGGRGGKGNKAFASATNRVPREHEQGTIGEKKTFHVVQRLIADLGLIGLPNAGKSSLLNELTLAKVKTAMYAFTTLEPNLGVLDDKVIADIPGLIEGASKGKGLGIKFLKHIEKVGMLVHCISADSLNVIADYDVVVTELKEYSPKLLEKEHIILLTKTDLVDEKTTKTLMKKLASKGHTVYPISIYNPDEFSDVKRIISK
ncbi:MAG: GTPase ObgE [bacterium]|nr:GTPase ObgE [bacterium]